MAEVAHKHQKQLKRIKQDIEKTYNYWYSNNQRFNSFRKFFLQSSITDADKTVLTVLQKPQLEFNIGEAYMSRQLGEFAKQMPSIEVHSADGYQVDPKTVEVVEGHLRAALHEANSDGFEYELYYESLSGGFSDFKVITEYENSMSFDQVIRFKKCFDSTLVGHDPLAQLPHKGDGRYCFELFPKSKEEFKREYPDVDITAVDFTRNIGGFNWAYKNGKEEIILIGHFYEKKTKKVNIVKLANNETMRKDEYQEYVQKWREEGNIAQPPAIVKSRMTDIQTIVRYEIIGNQVLEYVETDFDELPIPFVDGHSIKIRDGNNSVLQQITRPYLYQAHGIQRLKNLAGQSLANELENQVQHKFMVAKEGIPTGYEEAYKNIQQASTLVYNAYKDNDPNVPVPAPMPVPRVPAPPEVTNTFRVTDEVTQTILGSYDPGLGVNQQQLSGVAIVEAATQSNATAMPFIVSYLQALNQGAKIFVNLIPKYFVTPKTIPIINKEGRRSYVRVNDKDDPNSVSLKYPANALRVKIEAGVNFEVQKSRALQQLAQLGQAFPGFAQFMNEEGLGIIIDNLDIKGIELLKEKTEQFQEKMKQMQQAQMQAQMEQANKPNPMVQLKQQELQLKDKHQQMQSQLDAERMTNDRLKIIGELQSQKTHDAVQVRKAQAEEFSHLADMAIKTEELAHKTGQEKKDMDHRHLKEAIETHHKGVELGHKISLAAEPMVKEKIQLRKRGRPPKEK